jgi:ELWxxDGT repeat protein
MVTSVPNTGELKKLGTKLFTLAARQPGINPHQLWQYDMLAGTSTLVFDIGAGNSISTLTLINNKFYFQGTTSQKGTEPYISDGTTAGTFLLRDIFAGNGSSLDWNSFSRAGSLVAFTAYDATNGSELWVTNGTTAGTVLLKDVEPGNLAASELSFLGNLPNNVLIFAATTTTAGRELWRSDGTAAGTYQLKDLNAGSSGSDPYLFSNHNGYLYFSAYTATGGRELYRTDGTTAGTILLKDFTAGAGDSYLYAGATTGTEIVFGVQETTYGTELWKSNGTAAGTVLVKDVNPGTGNGVSSFYNSKVGNHVFFIGNNGVNGNELWATNGTAAGTQMVKDLTPGATGSGISFLGHNNGLLYFILNVSGAQELWQSDGTEAGTAKIILLGNTTIQSISHLTFINNLLVVKAYNAEKGYELFWLRGTPDHYRSLSDINPGTGSSNPASILTENNQLYFYANDGTGNSMYSFDNLATLPVSFGFFNGKKDGPGAVLTWKAYETANEQFVIERSANGLSFQQIGTVAAGVFSSRNYQFTDASPLKGTNYYRIKTREANGQPLYSATVQLRFDEVGSKFSIYPNPAGEKATIFFLASQKETVVLTVYDYSGKQAMVKTVPVQEGANMLPLSLQALAPGLYQLQITSAGGNEQVSFVKQ